MTRKFAWKFIPTFLFTIIHFSSSAQYYIREDWKQIKESPDSISLSRSIPDIDGDILQIGNEYDSTELSNISITCYSSLGIEKWNYHWNSGYDQADYGVAIKVDSMGNIYAAGVSYNPGSGWYETVIIKLSDTGGFIWDNIIDNPHGNAIVTSVDADNAGNAFVVANHESMSGSIDIYLTKLDSSGNADWTESYGYFGKDIGSKVLYSSSPSDQVSVYGLSEDSTNVWSYLTLTYDKEGNFIKAFRTKANDLYLETPEGFIEGNDQNFYLCGSQSNGITSRSILIKLNPDLNKIWIESSDSSNDEGAVVLSQDSDGSLYVSGWKQNADYRSISLKKFDTSGTLLWSRLLNPPASMNYSEPTAISADNDRVLITGFRRNANRSEIITAEYDTSGSFHWVERFYHDQTAISYPTDVMAINSSVYVTGNVVNTSQTQWVTIKYDITERDTANIYDEGKPIAAKNELIIRFNPTQVNTDEVDNVDQYSEYGSLEDYLKPSAYATVSDLLCSQAASSTQSYSTNCDEFKLLKVFKEMKTKDSITVSRLGDSIRIPKFWSTFVLSFPDGIDVKELSDSLNALFPLVIYCHINPTIELLGWPNDPKWFDQTSLQDPGVGDFGIAIDSAWDIQPSGKPEIRIGVFDSGIDWKHPDFGYDGVNRSSSKIAGGYDFYSNQDLLSLDSGETDLFTRHGTAVTGVLSALKNNNLGIAGIVGHDTVYGLKGCSTFGLAVTAGAFTRSNRLDYLAEAIVSSSILDSTKVYSYGLNIQNHSWRIHAVNKLIPYMTDSNIMILSDAISLANKAQVTVVAARGNEGHNNVAYPATYDDDWILCVGGTGTDGEYARSWTVPPSTGFQLDVSAPAADYLSYTIQAYGTYTGYNGTSIAAPHVSGVAALLMSYLNNDSLKLSPEDVEQILERTAVDTDYPGKDTLTGWGRLDAKQALRYVQAPANALHHFRSTSNNSSLQLSLVDTAFNIHLKEHVADHNSQWYAAGDYLVDVYRIDASNTHVIPASDTIKSSWPRPSSSNTLQALEGNTLIPHHKVYLDSVNKEKAWLYGYVYKLYDTAHNFLGWLPNDTTLTHYNLDYSVLSLDTTYQAPSGIEEPHEPNFSVSLYPNPSTDAVALDIYSQEAGTAEVTLVNAMGQTVYQISRRTMPNSKYIVPITTNTFQPGIYFVRVTLNQQTITKELVIIK